MSNDSQQQTTAREATALRYLNDKMETSAFLVGVALYDAGVSTGGYQAMGGAVLGSLRRRGFATQIGKGRWRITQAGRKTLEVANAE